MGPRKPTAEVVVDARDFDEDGGVELLIGAPVSASHARAPMLAAFAAAQRV